MAIKLRKKTLSTGKFSLYLLDSWDGEQRQYEFLKLYLYPRPKDPLEKEHNRETLKTAENIRAKRELLAASDDNGITPAFKKKVNFFEYFEQYIKTYTKKDVRMFGYALKYLKEYAQTDYLATKAVTENFCKGFREFMDNHPNLNGETPYDFFAKFKKVIKQAVRDKLFTINPAQDVQNKRVDKVVAKDILTVEELQLLAKTHCGNETVKRAFLFACNTGLRWCDIKILQWKHIQGASLQMTQQKTGKPVIINLNNTSVKLIGEKGKPEEPVFTLPSHTGMLKSLRYWRDRAGLSKTVTFHVARHSFATNLLIYETDVKTVSSLLGHTSLEHTQKYVRVVEALKQNAVNRLPEIEL